MKKSILCQLSASTMAALLLVSCGGGDAPATDDSAATEDSMSADDSAMEDQTDDSNAMGEDAEGNATESEGDEATEDADDADDNAEDSAKAEDKAAEKKESAKAEEKPAEKPTAVAAAKPPAAFTQCKICHGVNKGAKSGFGPNLYGVVGAKAGHKTDFSYSGAMKSSGKVWTEANLDEFLTSPAKSIPGNKMAFAGVKDAGKRKEIIAYLASLK